MGRKLISRKGNEINQTPTHIHLFCLQRGRTDSYTVCAGGSRVVSVKMPKFIIDAQMNVLALLKSTAISQEALFVKMPLSVISKIIKQMSDFIQLENPKLIFQQKFHHAVQISNFGKPCNLFH